MSKPPNFMHIGPDKAGSSWLHEVLIRHQQIFMPEAKDLYFFDRYYDRGLSWYLGQFSGARPRTSWSARYVRNLFHPEAPRRIAESLDDVRFMVTASSTPLTGHSLRISTCSTASARIHFSRRPHASRAA